MDEVHYFYSTRMYEQIHCHTCTFAFPSHFSQMISLIVKYLHYLTFYTKSTERNSLLMMIWSPELSYSNSKRRAYREIVTHEKAQWGNSHCH